MNTINILNGVTLASQEEVTGHTGNTTMHLTEEERTAWNSAAAIPDSSGTYTGNNTHAGVETFNGAVVLNGPVTSDALETGRMLAKVTACSCIPLISAFNATVKQKGPMGFNISRPADGRPVKVGGTGNPWGWWSKDKVVVQMNGPFLRWAHARLRILPLLRKIIMPMPIPYGKQAMPPAFISVFKSTVLCANSG